MSKKKLAGITVACVTAIIVVTALVILHPWRPPVAPPPLTYSLSIDVSPSGAGSVFPSGAEYAPGVNVTLTATPSTGYTFKCWNGSVSGTASVINITMNSDKSLTANFEPEPEPTSSPLPLNLRIDYIAIEDTMGEDDYEDPLYGEIQLIIVVSDGANEPQTCYVPQADPKGLEGFKIPDFGRRQLNQLAYHAYPAGDYLKVSILAYDLDSKDDLLTTAHILEALATAAGVPGADMLKLLISLLPVEDDRVGGYEAVWYPDESYGIGQHEVSCLDKFARANLFVGFSIWSDEEPSPLPVPSPFPDAPNKETLEYRMSPNVVTGSYVQYRRELLTGEKVEGHLQLTGEYPSADWDTTCCFWIYDPDGNEVYEWCEDFKSGGLYHGFSFTATRHGVYAIKVGHGSAYSRHLDMTISPYGWQ